MFFLKAVTNYKVFEVWFIYRRERVGFNSTTEASGKKEKKQHPRKWFGEKWNATKLSNTNVTFLDVKLVYSLD